MNIIDVKAESMMQSHKQYSEKLILTDSVAANAGQQLAAIDISSLGHFMCEFITGHFSTLRSITDGSGTTHIIDDGVNHLALKLVDGQGNRNLFSDFIPADLLLSPSRVKDALAENNYTDVLYTSTTIAKVADRSDNLFMPFRFPYIFATNSRIMVYASNNSNTACSYTIVFHGYRIIDDKHISVNK